MEKLHKKMQKLGLKDYKVYNSFFFKLKGLMFSKKKTVVFVFNSERKRGLHGFFVFFPIGLLFLDKNLKVVEKGVLKPFGIYNSKKKAQFVVEIAV